jgi:ribosomal protein S18 acetylase RimI-like enzyme
MAYPVEIGGLEADRAGVDRLVRACAVGDGIAPPFFLGAPVHNHELITSFGVVEGGRLTGFAHLPDDAEPEVCIAVHPEHRQRRIASALLAAVRAESTRRGLSEIILVTNAASTAGTAFVCSTAATFDFAEYQLVLERAMTPGARRHPGLMLRLAEPDETETLARICAAAFGDDVVEETRRSIALRTQEPNRRFFLGVLDDEPIGLLRTGAWPDGADITSFGVLPEYQGRGYGRQLLSDAVARLQGEGWNRISIEVETENANALSLYQSCGFGVTARIDYYRMIV